MWIWLKNWCSIYFRAIFIHHTHEFWLASIYRWFTHLWTSIYAGFPSQNRAGRPEIPSKWPEKATQNRDLTTGFVHRVILLGDHHHHPHHHHDHDHDHDHVLRVYIYIYINYHFCPTSVPLYVNYTAIIYTHDGGMLSRSSSPQTGILEQQFGAPIWPTAAAAGKTPTVVLPKPVRNTTFYRCSPQLALRLFI